MQKVVEEDLKVFLVLDFFGLVLFFTLSEIAGGFLILAGTLAVVFARVYSECRETEIP